jgi:hypothetical protein
MSAESEIVSQPELVAQNSVLGSILGGEVVGHTLGDFGISVWNVLDELLES